jgi:hypothetical protein
MYSRIGEGIERMCRMMLWGLVLFVPLGIWKIVDIIVWIVRNVSVSVGR